MTPAHTLPGEYFTSTSIFAEELCRIFRRNWVCVDRADRLTQAGDYLLVELGEQSVIVLRDGSGQYRALHNVCRHRGTRLCSEPHGRLPETIQCPYHAWTYGLDGRLIGAPHMDAVQGFAREDYPLRAVALQSWEGFLFLNLGEGPEPLDDALAPLQSSISRFGLPGLRSARRIEYDVQANWKLLVLNYSECLHCPVIHPQLAKLSPYQSGANDLTEGPILGGYMAIARQGGSLTASGRACGAPIPGLPEADHGRVYYYSIFPNMLLSLHPDYVMFHTLWPVDAAHTRVVCEWLFPPRTLDDPEANPEDAIEFWDTTNRQDWSICELGQEGIASAAYTPGPYSERESLLAAWDAEYLRQLGGADR
jgi:Rieske 2Fe-2S family protein